MLTHFCGLNRRRRLRRLGHAPPGAAPVRALSRLRQLQVKTYAGRYYSITPGTGGYGAGGTHPVQSAHVVQADVPCSNGVIHIVDRVPVR